MFHSFSKKIIVLTLIFTLVTSLFLPLLPVGVFAEDSDFCNQVKNATCDSDLKSLSEDSRLKDCGGSIQSGLLTLVNKCKANLDKQKAQTESQLKNLETQQSAAERTLSNLTWNIKKLNTEIASLNLSLTELENAIQEREKAIKELDDALGQHKAILSEAIRQIYEYNTLSYIEMLLGYRTLSDFNQKLEEIDRLQKSLKSSMEEIRKAKEQMEKEKEDLTQKKKEQEQYKAMQEMSKQSLALKQEQKQYLIQSLAAAKTPLEKEMARIEAELIELRSAMSKIQSYLGGWLMTGAPSWSQIISSVKYASSRTGTSTFLILGILQVESTFHPTAGKNMGSPEANLQRCLDNRKDDSLCYQQKPVFEQICAELGLDPNKVPISYAYAMGPAQFIPTTWRSYQKKDTAIINPWKLEDAVLAMAYKLGTADWKTAAYNYNPGGGSCTNYADTCNLSFYDDWSYCDKVFCSAKAWQNVYQNCGGFNLNCPGLQERLERMGIPAQ